MSILLSWLSPLRAICMAIDGIAFSLLDNAYNIVIELSKAEFMDSGTIADITRSLYIIFGVVAFFRLAMVLINSMIDPEKFSEKGKGVSNIFFRIVGMIIILFITPWLFEQAYKIQRTVVGADTNQNIIFQLFLGDNANIGGHDENGYNAGKALQNIVLSSLITVDDQYLVNDGATCSYNDNGQVVDSNNNVVSDVNSTCGFIPLTCVANSDGKTCTNQGGYIYDPDTCDWGNCQKAVSVYNEMYVNEDMSPNKLSKWVGTSTDLEDENGEETEVYVYDYMFIVTGVAGIFMTYVIISFAIDIAVRIFELVVLQVLSPLFIATFVDPKSAQSGPFKNWLSALGKSYANLFIKLAILALMTFFIMYLNKTDMFNNMGGVSGWAKLFVVIGLLIFAKKAPKWISEILGIKSDGMGLWSPSKLRENMAGIGTARAAIGAGAALIANRHANRLHNQAVRDKANKAIKEKEDNGEDLSSKEKRAIRRQYGATTPQSIFRNITGAYNAITQGSKAGKNAEGGIIATIKGGIDASGKFKASHGLGEEGKISRFIKSKGQGFQKYIWGNRNLMYDIEDDNKKLKKVGEWTSGGDFGRQDVGLGKGRVIAGQKDANALCDAIVENKGNMGNLNNVSFAAGQYALNQGCAKVDAKGNIDLSNVKIKPDSNAFEFKFDDGTTKQISFADLEKNVGGVMDSSSTGAINQAKMVNTYQTQALSNYQQNEQIRAQEVSSYQTTQSESSKIQNAISQLSSLLRIQLPSLTGTPVVTLDPTSSSTISNSVKTATEAIDSSISSLERSSKKEDRDKLDALKSLKNEILNNQSAAGEGSSAIADFNNIASTNLQNIRDINEAQEKLKSVVDSIDGITNSEKANNLSIQEKKISEKISSLEQKSNGSDES